MDRVKAAAATAELAAAAGSPRAPSGTGKYSRELVGRLALQLHLLKEGIRDVLGDGSDRGGPRRRAGLRAAERQRGDAALVRAGARHVSRAGPTTGTCSCPRSPAASQRDLPWLLISGFGAHRLLAQEVGLHVLELAGRGQAAPAGRRRGCGSPSRRWAICRPTSSAARSPTRSVAGRSRTPSCAATAASPRRWCATERQLAHGQARRRAARRLRPDRRQPGLGSLRPQAVRSIASSSSIMPSMTPRPFCQNSRLEASRPKGASSSEWCLEPPASSIGSISSTKPGCAS